MNTAGTEISVPVFLDLDVYNVYMLKNTIENGTFIYIVIFAESILEAVLTQGVLQNGLFDVMIYSGYQIPYNR